MSEKYETAIRCIPVPEELLEEAGGKGACILTGKPSKQGVRQKRIRDSSRRTN